MSELTRERRTPFVVVGVLIALVTLAIFRLPESFVAQIQNSGTFSLTERGWAFRLLALFALAQAAYVGFVLLRPERVKKARETEEKIAALSRAGLVRSLARTAAGAVLLTMIYGIAAFAASGFRSGFWFFVALCFVQGAWYYRETGQVAKWLNFQPETAVASAYGVPWVAAPPDYCPPIARALDPIGVTSPTRV